MSYSDSFFLRLLPEIIFPNGDIKNEKAEELVDMCPMKVFDIEDLGKGKTTKTL